MLTMTAVLSAIAVVLAFFKFHAPLSPSFVRMDLSDLPALIGAFAYGPIPGVLIELVKNVLQLPVSSTGGMGELADFIMGSSLVVAAGLIYPSHQTKKTAVAACLIVSVIMGIVAAIVNCFILFPAFEAFMSLEQLIASFGGFIPAMQTRNYLQYIAEGIHSAVFATVDRMGRPFTCAIDSTRKPVVILQEHCLHCGNYFETCPARAIERRQ